VLLLEHLNCKRIMTMFRFNNVTIRKTGLASPIIRANQVSLTKEVSTFLPSRWQYDASFVENLSLTACWLSGVFLRCS